jgi:hypothetical protein
MGQWRSSWRLARGSSRTWRRRALARPCRDKACCVLGDLLATRWSTSLSVGQLRSSRAARAQVGGVQLFCKRSFRWGNLRRRRKILGPVCAAGENLWAPFHPFRTILRGPAQRDAARQARVNPAPCVAAQTQTGLCTRHARHHCSAWPAGASASTRPLPAAAAPRGRSPRTLEATWRRPVGWGPRDRLVCLPRLAVEQDSSLVPQAHLDQLPLLGQGLASLIPLPAGPLQLGGSQAAATHRR